MRRGGQEDVGDALEPGGAAADAGALRARTTTLRWSIRERRSSVCWGGVRVYEEKRNLRWLRNWG